MQVYTEPDVYLIRLGNRTVRRTLSKNSKESYSKNKSFCTFFCIFFTQINLKLPNLEYS